MEYAIGLLGLMALGCVIGLVPNQSQSVPIQ